MKKIILFLMLTGFFVACGGEKTEKSDDSGETPKSMVADPTSYDPHRGEGKHTNVELGAKLDGAMAEAGDKIQAVKCSSCHKLTDEKLVGPGWKGVTTRRKPEWIMNMILNPVEMTQKDPTAQKLLEEHLTQMTFQNVTQEEARMILEYFRKKDGAK